MYSFFFHSISNQIKERNFFLLLFFFVRCSWCRQFSHYNYLYISIIIIIQWPSHTIRLDGGSFDDRRINVFFLLFLFLIFLGQLRHHYICCLFCKFLMWTIFVRFPLKKKKNISQIGHWNEWIKWNKGKKPVANN